MHFTPRRTTRVFSRAVRALTAVCLTCSTINAVATAQDVVTADLLKTMATGEITTDVVIDSFGVEEWSLLRDRLRENPRPAIREVLEHLAREEEYTRRLAVLKAVQNARLSVVDVFDEIAPELVSPDDAMREAAGSVAAVYSPEGRGGRDFSRVTILLRVESPARNDNIIRWAMREDPHAAFADVSTDLLCDSRDEYDRWRELQLAQHEIYDSLWREFRVYIPEDTLTEEAEAHLAALARADEWWARLYVAEIMLVWKHTRTPERIAALCQDPDPYIADRMAELCESQTLQPERRAVPARPGESDEEAGAPPP